MAIFSRRRFITIQTTHYLFIYTNKSPVAKVERTHFSDIVPRPGSHAGMASAAKMRTFRMNLLLPSLGRNGLTSYGCFVNNSHTVSDVSALSGKQ